MPAGTQRPKPSFDASRRSEQSEVLDGPIERRDLAAILSDLARFNGIMGGRRAVLSWLDRAVADIPKNRQVTILDVGCGYGDLLRAIGDWARKAGRAVKLIGLDLNPDVIAVARGATSAADAIEYEAADVFAFEPDCAIDFITSSLVTHHLDDDMIVRFLRRVEFVARRGWVIYDLQRSLVPFHFIAVAGFALRLHPVVIHDGRISVARSLTRAEWTARLADAGLPEGVAGIHWFLFRFVIGRRKCHL